MYRLSRRRRARSMETTKRTTTSQQLSRKYRKACYRRLRQQQFKKLQDVVPSIANKEKTSKLTVIEETIKYIEELHSDLAKRLKERGVTSSSSEEVDRSTLMNFVYRTVPLQSLTSPAMVCEKTSKVVRHMHPVTHTSSSSSA